MKNMTKTSVKNTTNSYFYKIYDLTRGYVPILTMLTFDVTLAYYAYYSTFTMWYISN